MFIPLSKKAADIFHAEEAKNEVQNKSDAQIEKETAYKWGGRALACYLLYAETNDLKWLLRGENYFHEAREHAAVAEDDGKTLGIIETEIKKAIEDKVKR